MKNKSNFFYMLSLSVIAIFIILCISFLNSSISIAYAINSTNKSIIQNQQNLQSSLNNQMQKPFVENSSNKINNNNNNSSNVTDTGNSQGQINISQNPFQQKATKIMDSVPTHKIRVGDMDVAYKQFGKGGVKPLVLITGLGATMDIWSPYLIDQLSKLNNRPIIIFDNRGAGESTTGIKDFSIRQFANDTVGLLDALHIKKADILGWSMGSFIAQEVALKNPQRVGSLILYASNCVGPNAIPPSPEVIHIFNNKSLTFQQLGQKIIPLMFPSEWFKANPNYINYFPIPKENMSSDVLQKQNQAIMNWNGKCDALLNIKSPSFVIVGLDDVFTPSKNSVNIVDKIQGAWLMQIRDAGHGLMYQYPQLFDKAVMMFLNSNDLKRSIDNGSISSTAIPR
jgi:pimeloyl-ACP methyl ester carboxylesterase